jgi:signal transduction histidine kinase/CheY-like chemotaxis protein
LFVVQTSSTEITAGTLGQRYFRRVAAIAVGLLLVSGLLEAFFGYTQARQQAYRAQAIQAQAAATEISQYLQALKRGLDLVQALPWGEGGFGLDERRSELHRLMALQPSVIEIQDVSVTGREVLAVSRSSPDRRESNRVVQPPAIGYGPVTYDQEGAPRMPLGLAVRGGPFARTVVHIDLRFLSDLASGLKPSDGGNVYIVDGEGQLIAHTDPTQALRQLKVDRRAEVQQAREAIAGEVAVPIALDMPGLAGEPSVTTAIVLDSPDWLLLVEQPRSQVLHPAVATIQRTLVLVAVSVLVAMFASAAFGRRMAEPIAKLRRATAEMAAGRLDQRLDVRTGDEIQGLAEDFNRMSERLQQSYRELEGKVEQRTAELAQRRDEAERANAAKTRFLASASHDLRQPMHAIGLLVELLRARLSDPATRDLADKTHEAVQSMESLFGSLLDISKLDAGAIRPDPRPFALQELLGRVQVMHAPLAQAKGLKLRVRQTLFATHTDPALLERIASNLVGNAIRYTRHGGVLVACRPRGDRVALQVVDTGVGIPADRTDLVFEEFVRLDDGTPGDKGLGLGLSIVRRTAQLLELEVLVRSRPGRGSVFEVLLPRTSLPGSASVLRGDVSTPLVGGFVLLVDDDDANLHASAALLRDWGCLVATASDADGAVAEAERHLRSPDVIVTDLRLGSGDHGLALIRRLREQAGSSVPALLVTADVHLPQPPDDDIQILRKPCGGDRLREALAQALARPAEQQAA